MHCLTVIFLLLSIGEKKKLVNNSQAKLKTNPLLCAEVLGSSLSKPETVSAVFRVREGGAIDLPCIAR